MSFDSQKSKYSDNMDMLKVEEAVGNWKKDER